MGESGNDVDRRRHRRVDRDGRRGRDTRFHVGKSVGAVSQARPGAGQTSETAEFEVHQETQHGRC